MSAVSHNILKNFTVAGGLKGTGPISAGLGYLVAKELLKVQGVNVKVLARSISAKSDDATELKALGAEVVEVEYSEDNQSALAKTIEGSDVVLCFFGVGPGLGAPQTLLAKVSALCGVKLFVPSEYGWDTQIVDCSMPVSFQGKKELQRLLREDLHLPYTLFWMAGLMEFSKFTFVPVNGTITVPGDGEWEVSQTWGNDLARFVAYVLTTLSFENLKFKTFAIEGSRDRYNDIIKMYNTKYNTTLKVIYEDLEETLKKYTEGGDLMGYVWHQWAIGRGVVTKDKEALENGLIWKEWNPKGLEEFL